MSTKFERFMKVSHTQLGELSTNGSITVDGVAKKLTDSVILLTEDIETELLRAELNGEVTALRVIFKIIDSSEASNTLSLINSVYEGEELLGYNPNLLIDWGDGKIADYSNVGVDGNIEHTYNSEGIYTIKLYNCEYLPSITGNSGNFSISNVKLANITKAIDNNAFSNVYNFTEIRIPESVYWIGSNAFVPSVSSNLTTLKVYLEALDFSTLILEETSGNVFPATGCKIIVDYSVLEDAKTAIPNYSMLIDAYILTSEVAEKYALKSELTQVERWW